MPEKTLTLGLNGEEIIEAVVDKVRAAMRKDCFLNPVSCYDWFKAEIEIHLMMNDCGRRPECTFHVEPQEGERTEGGRLEDKHTTVNIPAAPPNQVRVETDQPVPVLTSDKDGKPEIRRVSYRGQKGTGASAGAGVPGANELETV